MSEIIELQQQISDLQARVTFQEDVLQALDDIVANQDKTIQHLYQKLSQWESRLDDMAYTIEAGKGSGSEKPPHY